MPLPEQGKGPALALQNRCHAHTSSADLSRVADGMTRLCHSVLTTRVPCEMLL